MSHLKSAKLVNDNDHFLILDYSYQTNGSDVTKMTKIIIFVPTTRRTVEKSLLGVLP